MNKEQLEEAVYDFNDELQSKINENMEDIDYYYIFDDFIEKYQVPEDLAELVVVKANPTPTRPNYHLEIKELPDSEATCADKALDRYERCCMKKMSYGEADQEIFQFYETGCDLHWIHEIVDFDDRIYFEDNSLIWADKYGCNDVWNDTDGWTVERNFERICYDSLLNDHFASFLANAIDDLPEEERRDLLKHYQKEIKEILL
jgi:hypothetical protein